MDFKLEKELSLFEKKKIGKLYEVSHKFWFYPETFVIIAGGGEGGRGGCYIIS